jgi:hypothetical protein
MAKAKVSETRAPQNTLRVNGNPNWYKGMPSSNPKGNPDITRLQANVKKRKIASDWLIGFYHSNPHRLKKLMMRLVNEAEAGKNIRFLEIAINLLEGPAKETGVGDTYNFNFLSDGERQRAQESVKRINALKAIVKKSITVLPEAASGNEPESENRVDGRRLDESSESTGGGSVAP